jgi:hypothetical protein
MKKHRNQFESFMIKRALHKYAKKSPGQGAHPKTQTLIEYMRSIRKNINVEGNKAGAVTRSGTVHA